MSSNKSNPRYWVWRLLAAVWGEKAYGNLAWPRLLDESTLSERDRRFSTELGYGLLRQWGQVVVILEKASGRKVDRLDREVLWVLAMGAYQLLYMRVPAHAAVKETVDLAVAVGLRSARGLVNAVLRRVAERGLTEWFEDLIPSGISPEEALAVRTAHPAWIVRRISQALDREAIGGELFDCLAANNVAAPVTLCLLPGLESPKEGELHLRYSPIGVHRVGNPSDDARVQAGGARVQDEGSQLVSLIAARAIPLRSGERVLDACAGPGGKAAVLAAEVIRAGAHLTAIDRSEHRAGLVREALKGLVDHSKFWEVLHADAVDYLEGPSKPTFDRILLDAPCSGLGALRRRPEARWTKSEAEIAELVAIQRRLSSACVRALRPGGYFFYVTCSPVVEETTDLVEWLISRESGLELVDTGDLLDAVSREKLVGYRRGTAVQLWPHRHKTDAMFIQAIRKAPAVRL